MFDGWQPIKWLRDRTMGLVDEVTRISGQDYEPTSGILTRCLTGMAGVYAAGVGIRTILYDNGLLRAKQLPCPVISIGNIVAGGAGKTPMAMYLAGVLQGLGYRPVVVSRGYKGSLKASAAIVGDGRKVFLDADTVGDEPYMMAKACQFPVVVGRKRYLAGRLALDELDVDVVILDDGFQHRELDRDLNLVLFDYQRPFGNGRMLPAGRLRESPGICRKRTHGVVFTRCPSFGDARDLKVPAPVADVMADLPAFYTRHMPVLVQMQRASGLPETQRIEELKGSRALLFSGIANNASFRETAEQLGVTVVCHLEFLDHYRYKRSDFKHIQQQAEVVGAEWIMTTEKDWVKIDSTVAWRTDLAVIGVNLTFEDTGAFTCFMKSRMRELTTGKNNR